MLSKKLSSDEKVERTLLAKYIDKFTKRQTTDYFIHKDLDGFLRRELDFYLKNEVLNLDGVEDAEPAFIESQLAKVKLIRKIATQLIEFLAQLENFQKKLWLKKKSVVETNYCLTLNRVPDELYPEVIANKSQLDEWIQHFAIDEIDGDLDTPGFTNPLTLDFLAVNQGLVLDTKFFEDEFKERLLASIADFDSQSDGLLVHSENFQALNLLQNRYREQIQCIYIDPPYNTTAKDILYKDGYRHSSWLSLLRDRVSRSTNLMQKTGNINVAIDDAEVSSLKFLLDEVFGRENFVSTVVIQQNPGGRSDQKHVAVSHEYLHIYARNFPHLSTNELPLSEKEIKKRYPHEDNISRYRKSDLRKTGDGSLRIDRPNLFYPIYYSPKLESFSLSRVDASQIKILPIKGNLEEGRWRCMKETVQELFTTNLLVERRNEGFTIYEKDRAKTTEKPKSCWFEAKHNTAHYGTKKLSSMFNSVPFAHPKSVSTVLDILTIGSSNSDTVLDYFGGSGTTAVAVIEFNRKDPQSSRKYILVEMGHHFVDVLKPRILKSIYAEMWKDGKPVSTSSLSSHCFKYVRLESYEDTLNNLEFDSNKTKTLKQRTESDLYKDYMLKYWLDIESQGSNSLLNVAFFRDPLPYTLSIKKPGSLESETKQVDLIETFNYLIGLRVRHISSSKSFTASFKEVTDPELPNDQVKKLVVENLVPDTDGPWWFRKVEGWVPKNVFSPSNEEKEHTLIIWRKLTDNLARDNLVLNEWFNRVREADQNFTFDRIYVNGSSNLATLKQNDDRWEVCLLEEKFLKCMWQDNTE
ncbi:MAG: site-specific DNA-methyltransferase [Gammaproteobacteria bacterium]|nr:site-specific DNA-methyltransferase [Gammaproteobacteria bacterium]